VSNAIDLLMDKTLWFLVHEVDGAGIKSYPVRLIRNELLKTFSEEDIQESFVQLRYLEYVVFSHLYEEYETVVITDSGRAFVNSGNKFFSDSDLSERNLPQTLVPASDRMVTIGDNSGVIINSVENLTISINSHNDWKSTDDKEIAQSGMGFLKKIVSSKIIQYTLIASGIAFLTWLIYAYPGSAVSKIADQLLKLLQAVAAK
jgi:hypothetical protein